MPTDILTLTDDGGLDRLIEDAHRLPRSMQPRPRVPRPRRVIDLTALEITIPDATLSLLDGYETPYGA